MVTVPEATKKAALVPPPLILKPGVPVPSIVTLAVIGVSGPVRVMVLPLERLKPIVLPGLALAWAMA